MTLRGILGKGMSDCFPYTDAVAFVSCHLLIVMHFKYLGDSDFSSTQDATALQHAAMYKERISQRRNRRKGLLLQTSH